jgi:hypothetical protein
VELDLYDIGGGAGGTPESSSFLVGEAAESVGGSRRPQDRRPGLDSTRWPSRSVRSIRHGQPEGSYWTGGRFHDVLRGGRNDDVDLETDQIGGQGRKPLVPSLRRRVLDPDVPAVQVAEVPQPVGKRPPETSAARIGDLPKESRRNTRAAAPDWDRTAAISRPPRSRTALGAPPSGSAHAGPRLDLGAAGPRAGS